MTLSVIFNHFQLSAYWQGAKMFWACHRFFDKIYHAANRLTSLSYPINKSPPPPNSYSILADHSWHISVLCHTGWKLLLYWDSSHVVTPTKESFTLLAVQAFYTFYYGVCCGLAFWSVWALHSLDCNNFGWLSFPFTWPLMWERQVCLRS